MQTPGQAQCQRDAAILANKKKVTKMLFVVVLMFGICWFPFQMFNFLTQIVDLSFYGVNYIWMASHILAMSNSSCNPFIYGIYNEKFRHEFDRKLPACLRRAPPPDANDPTQGQVTQAVGPGGQLIRSSASVRVPSANNPTSVEMKRAHTIDSTSSRQKKEQKMSNGSTATFIITTNQTEIIERPI